MLIGTFQWIWSHIHRYWREQTGVPMGVSEARRGCPEGLTSLFMLLIRYWYCISLVDGSDLQTFFAYIPIYSTFSLGMMYIDHPAYKSWVWGCLHPLGVLSCFEWVLVVIIMQTISAFWDRSIMLTVCSSRTVRRGAHPWHPLCMSHWWLLMPYPKPGLQDRSSCTCI